MADIELVIKMPEFFYEALRKNNEIISGQRSGKTLMSVICNAVANGTPLPKRHGKLIDADELLKDRHRAIPVINVIEAPTIIEADKESEDRG